MINLVTFLLKNCFKKPKKKKQKTEEIKQWEECIVKKSNTGHEKKDIKRGRIEEKTVRRENNMIELKQDVSI